MSFAPKKELEAKLCYVNGRLQGTIAKQNLKAKTERKIAGNAILNNHQSLNLFSIK